MSESTHRCPDCGKEIATTLKVCPDCLHSMQPGDTQGSPVACPDCGKANGAGEESCWNCGYRLDFQADQHVESLTPGLLRERVSQRSSTRFGKSFRIFAAGIIVLLLCLLGWTVSQDHQLDQENKAVQRLYEDTPVRRAATQQAPIEESIIGTWACDLTNGDGLSFDFIKFTSNGTAIMWLDGPATESITDTEPRYCKYSLDSNGQVKLQFQDGGYMLERLTLDGDQLIRTLFGVSDGVHGYDSVGHPEPWTYTRVSE